MPNESKNILQAITDMAADDNQGCMMTTTILEAYTVRNSSRVVFQVTDNIVRSALNQAMDMPSDMLCVAFFIDKKELEKYK